MLCIQTHLDVYIFTLLRCKTRRNSLKPKVSLRNRIYRAKNWKTKRLTYDFTTLSWTYALFINASRRETLHNIWSVVNWFALTVQHLRSYRNYTRNRYLYYMIGRNTAEMFGLKQLRHWRQFRCKINQLRLNNTAYLNAGGSNKGV